MKRYVSLLIAVLLLIACEKNKNNDPGITSDNQRIKEAFYDYEGEDDDWKSEFIYEGERLITIIEYIQDDQGAWVEDYKAEIAYGGNKVTVTWYYYDMAGWEPAGKNDYLIENGLIREEINFDYTQNQWIEDWKWSYQYSGSNLVAWQSYNYNQDGIPEQDEKGEYVYTNNLLAEYIGFEKDETDAWVQYDRETFLYSGTDITGWVDFDLDNSDNWIEADKCEYSYSGENISTAMYYDWDDGINNWESDPFSVSYSYNGTGYFTGWVNDDGEKATFIYEEGLGNAKLLWYYPEELVYGEPTLKTTTVRNRFVPYYKRTNPTVRQVR